MNTPSSPLLQTKLHRPPVIAETVHRKRLHEVMDRALGLPLTLVSAPAGYGKSTLVSQWAESQNEPLAWLSLEAEDSDVGVFVRYFLAAIRSVVAEACPATHHAIMSPNPVRRSLLGPSLVNELDRLDTPVVLVLDDYHRIEPSSDVHELLWFLLEHPSPKLRLILVSRTDPPFAIASLRGRGQIAEVRHQDLRFSTGEVAEYLEHSTHLTVSDEARANLERQTEGWIIAMRLVALHLGGEYWGAYSLRERLDDIDTAIVDAIDADGYLSIVGRNKDLIISGGYNIYPKEIELLLDDQPGVLESAVIGVPHPDFGETVVGVLVPQNGATPDLGAISEQIGTSLARFKQPRKLIVLDELPRNTMGKVQKNLLRQDYADLFTRG